jgi:hypothetical protein
MKYILSKYGCQIGFDQQLLTKIELFAQALYMFSNRQANNKKAPVKTGAKHTTEEHYTKLSV